MLKMLLLIISTGVFLPSYALPCHESFNPTDHVKNILTRITNTLNRELTPKQVKFIQKYISRKPPIKKKNSHINSISILNFLENDFLIHEISTLLRNGIIKESRKTLYNDIYVIEAMQSVLNQTEPLSPAQTQLLMKAKVFVDMTKWKKPVEMFEIEFFLSHMEQIVSLSQENQNLTLNELEHLIRTVFKVFIKKTTRILQYVEKREKIKQHLTTFNGLALAGTQRRLVAQHTFEMQSLLKGGFTVEDVKTLQEENMISSDHDLKQLVQDALDSFEHNKTP